MEHKSRHLKNGYESKCLPSLLQPNEMKLFLEWLLVEKGSEETLLLDLTHVESYWDNKKFVILSSHNPIIIFFFNNEGIK